MSEAAEQQMAVECRGIERWFGEGDARVQVLRGVDLSIAMGQLAMLVGPSGCGKTTLISIVTGLLDASAGDTEVLGRSIASLTAEEQMAFRRKDLGFVFQQFNLIPSLTAAENVAVPLYVSGVPWGEGTQQATALLEKLGMAERASALPSSLSGGQQQRVALGRALIHNPRLIVCDEPTSALDARSGMNVMQLLSDVALQRGRAVIVVTHDSRIFDFADTIAHMEDGRITHVERGQAAHRSVSQAEMTTTETYS